MIRMDIVDNFELSSMIASFKELYYITHNGIEDCKKDRELYIKNRNNFNNGPYGFVKYSGLLKFTDGIRVFAFFNNHGVCVPTEFGKLCKTFEKVMEDEEVQRLCNTDMFEIYSSME